jgi:Leucine-rich repeat (LRR) protein
LSNALRRGGALLATLVFLCAYAPRAEGDEAVTFADPALEAAMKKATGVSPVTRTALERLTGSLDLTFMGIESVDGLQYATGVAELLLTGNAITDIGPLTSLSELRRLDLDRNPIAALPDDMSELAKLTELHLGGTRLTRLPEILTALPRLRRLYLEELDIVEPADLTDLADTLNRLFLSGSSFPDWSFLAALTKLELLFMRNCGLTELPGSIASLTALRYVYMQNNELEELPEWFGKLTRLERLDLTGNRLYALPSSMASLTRLRQLVLSGNEFFSLPGWITGLTGLEVLLVSDNHLTRVPDGFYRLGNLYRFSFQNNNLTSIAQVGRIPVGYPYQVSFMYNLLDLSDAATAGLLDYYDKAGSIQKTPSRPASLRPASEACRSRRLSTRTAMTLSCLAAVQWRRPASTGRTAREPTAWLRSGNTAPPTAWRSSPTGAV